MARSPTTNATAAPTTTTTTVNAALGSDAGSGITPVWNPMVILAFFYAVLFLIFAAAVAFIFVRRRRRARAETEAPPSPTTTATTSTSDPEKGQSPTPASVSGDSDYGDADKTVFIAQVGPAGECKGSPTDTETGAGTGTGTGTGTGAGTGTRRDAPSEYWTPPQLRTMRFPSRGSARTSLAYQYQHGVSELSIAQREPSQVLVWLPSFQSHAGGGAGPGAARAVEGEQSPEKRFAEEQAPEREEGPGTPERAQEEERVSERQERDEEEAKDDSESGCGVAQ